MKNFNLLNSFNFKLKTKPSQQRSAKLLNF